MSTALEIATALGAKANGKGWTARCCAHADDMPSLSINEGANGKVLLKCHAGCEQSALIEALAARGLWSTTGLTVAELATAKHLPEQLLRDSGFADDEQRGHAVVRIEYRGRDDEVMCTRYRGSIGANGSGPRFWFRRGDKQQLFGLWRLRSEPVIVVEGETDTLALWSAGFNAIGVPGADAWRDDRFADELAQCPLIHVHIEPDVGGEKFRAAFGRSRLSDRIRFFTVAPTAKDPCELRARDPQGFYEAIATAVANSAALNAPAADSQVQPVIDIRAGELPRMVIEAQDALIATDAGIYQRGGQLVRVVALEKPIEKDGVKRAAGSLVILPVAKEYLRLVLCRAATWCKYDARAKKDLRTDAPQTVAAALMAAAGEWRFPHLSGLVCAPTLRGDGSLLQEPGYDTASGLYAAFREGDFPAINPRPSREDALRAFTLLEDLFVECDFAGGRSSAHATALVAATITACVRQALPTAPAFAVSAAKAGSGKTTAAKAIAHVSIGRDPPAVSLGEDETELRKALLSMLIAGDTIVLIDNVARPIDSAALCAILTSATYRDRVLGASQQVTVSTASTWLVTGNSLEFVGDLTSRTLLSVLDPLCEQPESRTFARDLPAYVAEHRAELLAAALTIPLAYLAAGKPDLDAKRSRFREWDAYVRRPLLWLGVTDPLDSQAELRCVDPQREALANLLGAWHEEFGNGQATVAQVIDRATRSGMSARPRLYEALLDIAGEKDGAVNAKRLGRYLKRSVRRIEGGLRLEHVGEDALTHRQQYRVTGVTGVSGVSFPLRARDSREDVNHREVATENAGNASNDEIEF